MTYPQNRDKFSTPAVLITDENSCKIILINHPYLQEVFEEPGGGSLLVYFSSVGCIERLISCLRLLLLLPATQKIIMLRNRRPVLQKPLQT